MYRVLVPVDEDENRALHQAKYVEGLRGPGAEIEATVLYVVPPSEMTGSDETLFEAQEAAVAAADHLEDAGVTVNRAVGDGGVAQEIVRISAGLPADEIVMGGRRRSGMAAVVLGSTVQDVFRSTDLPVTITGTGMVLDERRNLLLPVDDSGERANHQAAYVEGLPAAPEEIHATVLHVFPHQDYEGAPPHDFEDAEAAVAVADRLQEAGVDVERQAVGGEVAPTIIETAAETDADGFVIGGRKRSGVQKVLVGSTAQDVILSADRPVTLTG